MSVILNRKDLKAALVNVPSARCTIMSVIALRMRHRHPAEKRRHGSIFLRRQNHVPVVVQPLVGKQLNRKLFQALDDSPLERFEVFFLEENVVASISAI